jgi:hypothetical protein
MAKELPSARLLVIQYLEGDNARKQAAAAHDSVIAQNIQDQERMIEKLRGMSDEEYERVANSKEGFILN